MRERLSLAGLIPLLLVQGCAIDTFTSSAPDGSADAGGNTEGGSADAGAADAQPTCPLERLNKNTGFEVNDGVWALSNSSISFLSQPHSGARSLELVQGSNVNFGFAKQDIGGGRALVRLWYRKHDSRPEFQTLRLEIQPDGIQRTFGAPWPADWTCATARVESGDGGAGTFFVSGYQSNKDAGAGVLVDDLEVFALSANDPVPKGCDCPSP